MKKFPYLAVALLAVAACSREQVIPDEPVPGPMTEPTGKLVSVTLVSGSPETRTELGTVDGKPYPFWSAGDNIWVLPARVDDFSDEDEYPVTLFTGGLTEASQSASFTGDIEVNRTYLAFYPNRQWWDEENEIWHEGQVNLINCYDAEGVYVSPELHFQIPTEQYPTRNSFDKKADFLVSEPFTVAAEDITDGKATVDDVCFTRVNAIVKVVLHDMTSNRQLNGQVVKKVVLGDYYGGDIKGRRDHAPADKAETRAEYDGPNGNYWGLAGYIEATVGEDGSCNYYFSGDYGIAAIYTDGTDGTENTQYAFQNGQHSTYFITIPCVVSNRVYEDDEDEYVDGLHIRVETDQMIIDRKVDLPEDGIGLQPSRITTLNIGLYDDGVNKTTITENGFSFMWWDSEEYEYHPVSELSVKEDTYEELQINLVGLTLNSYNWESELQVSCEQSDYVRVDLEEAYYSPNEGVIGYVRVWGDQATAADSPVTVTFSAGGYSSSLQVNVAKANTPASISLDGFSDLINLDQYDALSLNATITPDDPTKDLDVNHVNFACYLIDPTIGSETLINGATFEEAGSDPSEMLIKLPAITDAGEFELKFTYKDASLLTIPFKVWADAELPEALQDWHGTSSDYWYAPSDKRKWFDDYKNPAGGLRTYAASLIEEIPNYAFAGAFKESSSGGFDAFKYFTGLSQVPEYAFYDCQHLTGITLPVNITSIAQSAFENSTALTSIQLPGSITEIGNNAFNSSGIGSINLPEGLKSIGESAFWGCHGLQAISIPGSIETLGDNAFMYTGLTSVSFSTDIIELTELPLQVFYGTEHLTSISIPQSVEVIGESAFSKSGLETVVIPEGVTTVGESAFASTQLTTVTLPSSVTSIGEYAFNGCPMTSAYLLPETPPSVADNAFRPTPENGNFKYPIYVPSGSLSLYVSAAANWIEGAYSFDTSRIQSMP